MPKVPPKILVQYLQILGHWVLAKVHLYILTSSGCLARHCRSCHLGSFKVYWPLAATTAIPPKGQLTSNLGTAQLHPDDDDLTAESQLTVGSNLKKLTTRYDIVSVHCREEGCIGKYTPRGPRDFPRAGILHPEAREIARGQSRGHPKCHFWALENWHFWQKRSLLSTQNGTWSAQI